MNLYILWFVVDGKRDRYRKDNFNVKMIGKQVH